MPLRRLSIVNTGVSDLSPLVGMPLEQLDIAGTQVRDLAPLAGMPLTRLNFRRTAVEDVSPLKGMPLETLAGSIKPKRDLEILRTLKSLKEINDVPAAEFFKKFSPN
jgi:Leucine-rich repeat (LRR) protein